MERFGKTTSKEEANVSRKGTKKNCKSLVPIQARNDDVLRRRESSAKSIYHMA